MIAAVEGLNFDLDFLRIAKGASRKLLEL